MLFPLVWIIVDIYTHYFIVLIETMLRPWFEILTVIYTKCQACQTFSLWSEFKIPWRLYAIHNVDCAIWFRLKLKIYLYE